MCELHLRRLAFANFARREILHNNGCGEPKKNCAERTSSHFFVPHCGQTKGRSVALQRTKHSGESSLVS